MSVLDLPTAEQLAQEAVALVTGDRNRDYGHPDEDFQRTAEMWSGYLQSGYLQADVGVLDVPLMMMQVKMSRMKESPYKVDHVRDLIGYALTYWMVVLRRIERGCIDVEHVQNEEKIEKHEAYLEGSDKRDSRK